MILSVCGDKSRSGCCFSEVKCSMKCAIVQYHHALMQASRQTSAMLIYGNAISFQNWMLRYIMRDVRSWQCLVD